MDPKIGECTSILFGLIWPHLVFFLLGLIWSYLVHSIHFGPIRSTLALFGPHCFYSIHFGPILSICFYSV